MMTNLFTLSTLLSKWIDQKKVISSAFTNIAIENNHFTEFVIFLLLLGNLIELH